jgi:hypothetical protein
MPVIGFQSTIDNPLCVSRVAPPTPTMRMMLTQTNNNQICTLLSLLSTDILFS